MLEWIKVGENLALEHNRGRTGWQIQRFHIYSGWFLFRKNWILGAFVFLILYIWALLRRMYVVTPNWLQFEVTKKSCSFIQVDISCVPNCDRDISLFNTICHFFVQCMLSHPIEVRKKVELLFYSSFNFSHAQNNVCHR